MINTKICGCCKVEKELKFFSKKCSKTNKYSSKCKECHNTYFRENWYKKNQKKHINSVTSYKSRNKSKVISHRLGVSEVEVAKLLREQDSCEICNTKEHLCVDHDHVSYKVRGMLCRGCNWAIGFLGDSKESVLEKLPNILNYMNKDYN